METLLLAGGLCYFYNFDDDTKKTQNCNLQGGYGVSRLLPWEGTGHWNLSREADPMQYIERDWVRTPYTAYNATDPRSLMQYQ